MDHNPSKPKLLFFQYRYGENLPEFMMMHRLHQVKCLSEFFDVVPIQKNCDYRRVCAQHEPDLALFEMLSDTEIRTSHRLKISNVSASSDIPKLALFNADAFGTTRAGFISDMEHLGIDTAFSICTTAAEHTPELADKLFVWPNFIDADVYRDYGQPKVTPVFFTGAIGALYPWRRKIQKVVADCYPYLLSPHSGYEKSSTARMMYGESYARAINASWFVPTCGSVAKEILRKHFEIPGCKACLITEKSAGLEAAGFVDMQSCVFADETDILDKLAYLFDHLEELTRIIQAGYDLVHSRHTLRQRGQILEWFYLHKKLGPGQRIVQENPFGPLAILDGSSRPVNSCLKGNGVHLKLLQQGDAALWRGDYAAAEAFYRRSSNYVPGMPEPKFRLALSSLYQGNAKAAQSRITELIQHITNRYKAPDPDPVEWAYFIVSLLCLGKLNKANRRASQFAELLHPDLDYARWAVEALKTVGKTAPSPHGEIGKHRCSIHQMPRRSFKDWIDQLCIMLRACEQPELSAALIEACRDFQKVAVAQQKGGIGDSPKKSTRTSQKKDNRSLPGLRRRVAYLLNRLEARCGYYFPYHLSEMRNDEFLREVWKLAREQNIRTALLIGAAKVWNRLFWS